VSREPRVDAYIEKAQPFARPIIRKVRDRVHAIAPDIEEAMKWGHPTFCSGGKIVLGTAAFKAHAVINFWRGQELGFDTKDGAMGQLGKPDQIALLAAYVLSPDAGIMTGALIDYDQHILGTAG